jgi:DNA-binding Xre family transcriptional regulator
MQRAFSSVELKVPELMKKQGVSAPDLWRDSAGRIGRRTAYRIANGEKDTLYLEEIAALCDLLGVEPGDLFERRQGKKR